MAPRPPRILLHRAANGRWYYRVKAGNNRVVDDSEQGYRSKWYAKRKALRAWPGGVVEVVP